MKKNLVYSLSAVFILSALTSADIAAQKIEIIPFAGYQTSAKINAYQGYFRVNDGKNFGASVNLGRNAYKIELSYSRQGSMLTYFPDDNSEPVINNLVVHYGSIGGLLEFFQGDPVVPFIKIGFGGTYYQPVDSETDTENVMHFNFSGGAKLYVSDHIGFRLQASLLLPVFFEGLYFAEAAPEAGEGMKTKIAGVQGDLTAGVVLRF